MWFKPNFIVIDRVRVTTDLQDVTKIIRKGLYKETYEKPERILIKKALKPDDRVLEIGGGIGLVSLAV